MIDTTVLLSFCYALVVRANLMWWEALFRLRTAFGLEAFGSEAFGSAASDLAASGLAASVLTTGFLVLVAVSTGLPQLVACDIWFFRGGFSGSR
jgi:hypothetical protein